MNGDVLVFGAGQVAQVFAEYLGWSFATYVVDSEYLPLPQTGKPAVSYAIACGVEKSHPPENYEFVVGMSFKGMNQPRAQKFMEMRLKGYRPCTYLHPDSAARASKIGEGSFVMEGNTIQTGVEIGENVIVWSGSHIGHHSRIGDHVFVASQVVISGDCQIGEHSFIGVNATIAHGVKIGKRNLIGAGALILKDTPDDAVFQPKQTEQSRVPSYRVRW